MKKTFFFADLVFFYSFLKLRLAFKYIFLKIKYLSKTFYNITISLSLYLYIATDKFQVLLTYNQ